MLKKDAVDIFNETITSVKPAELVNKHLSLENTTFTVANTRLDISSFKNIYVVGAGKASAGMACALEGQIGSFIHKGLVVVNYGNKVSCDTIEVIEAAHPIPDENSLVAGRRILELVSRADEDDLVLVLISGGGSALLESLPQGIGVLELKQMNNALIACGANINEINTIRKHISLVKGGRLARKIFPASCLTLIISDVPGDNLQSIASGPTTADSSTFSDAMDIVDKYNLAAKIHPVILDYLQKGMLGKAAETCKSNNPVFKNVNNIIIGNNVLALQFAREIAERKGYQVCWQQKDVQGEARDAALIIADKMLEISGKPGKLCLLFGGETTVTIRGNGKGGRNQELVLAALIATKNNNRPFALLGAGTDGADGPTDAAGAVITNDTLKKVDQKNIDPLDYLNNNDAYNFFDRTGGLLKTGLTGTNVMDMVIVLMQ